MWIADEQYSRGYLHWVSESVSSILINSTEIDANTVRTIEDQSFIFLNIDTDVGQVEIKVSLEAGAPKSEIACWLEWVDDKGDIQCRMWSKGAERVVESSSVYATGLGYFHRLVIDGAGVNWETDRVYRLRGGILRFRKGLIHGHRTKTTGSVPSPQGHSATMQLGPEQYSGQFIEIISQGNSERDAKRSAYGTAGYLALVFGRTVIREVLFDSGIFISKNDMMREKVSGKVEFFYILELPEEAFVTGLTTGLHELATSVPRPVINALERFAQAKRTSSDELQLAAHFSGIELLVRAFESEKGGVPEIQDKYRKHEKAFTKFLDTVGDEGLKNKIMGSLKHASIQLAFDFYTSKNSLESEDFSKFKKIADARNTLFHSGTAAEIHELNQASMRILQRLLEHELKMPANSSWNKYPLFEITAPLQYPERGWCIPWTNASDSMSLSHIESSL